MHSVQAAMWDPRPPSKHAPPSSSSSSRPAHLSSAPPAKRITFYKSGDSQFGGVRMAVHKRSFKCFDALLDDLSQKVPLPFGVRTVTTPRGTNTIKHLEQLQDGGCYLCSDRRHAQPIGTEQAGPRPSMWHHHHHARRPQRPDSSSLATPPGQLPYRQRRVLLVKNGEPGVRRSVVLSRRNTRSMAAFLEEASDLMQFHVRKLYTAEGRKVDGVQSLMTCPGVLVCVGREAFSPTLLHFIKRSSEEKLPGVDPLGPRTPGTGARSPATQGTRSPPRGAQSRASEDSEGHDSKKNVNFGLETKKSIIHPRSDSSNRSARFSLSSEKSYGVRPALVNDDIEKRVLVNKDGSLSVEMRVRFRLHNEETLQWSTQIKKSPPLTNDCCPLSQGQSHFLHKDQSESCSDPESLDYSNRSMQRTLEANRCACCYQTPELHYDLWENPAHRHRQPLPPSHPHPSGHAHTGLRHTHSSSSSSSCSSRRVVRCRARLSSSGRGSEQSQLIREEETCVTEHRVELDGETRVEVCRVSRCCSRGEAVAVDNGLRGEEEELVMEEDQESAVSSSSHVLQTLRDDQEDEEDEEMPPSASQCCHGNGATSSPSAQSEPTQEPSSKISESGGRAESEEEEESKTSRDKILNSERGDEEEQEEVNRAVSGLSAASHKSGASSLCSNCGGCKPGVSSASIRAGSQTSRRASPKPASPLCQQENATKTSNDEGSDDSAMSTRSNKTNLSTHGGVSALSNVEEERAPSAVSNRKSGLAQRPISSLSAKSGVSLKSPASVKSHKSNCPLSPEVSSPTRDHDDRNKIIPSSLSERAESSRSAKSDVRAKSSCSRRADEPDPGTGQDQEVGRAEEEVRAVSATSAKTNKSHKSIPERSEVERPASQRSARSVISNKSATSSWSQAAGEETGNEVLGKEKRPEGAEEEEEEERAASVLSAKSQRSKQVVSVTSGRSKSSARSNASHRSKNLKSVTPRPNTTNTAEEEEERSCASAKSGKSNVLSHRNGTADITEDKVSPRRTRSSRCSQPQQHLLPGPRGADTRGSSALSVHSTASAKSGRSKCLKCGGAAQEEVEEGASRRGSEQPLSPCSSVSLGLAEDQDTAESESEKSSVSFHARAEGEGRVEKVKEEVPQSPESKKEEEVMGAKKSVNVPAVPTIKTPGGGNNEKDEEGGGEEAERGASACSARSCRACDNDLQTAEKPPSEPAAGELAAPCSRTSSRSTVRNKSSASRRGNKIGVEKTADGESEKNEDQSRAESDVHTKTPCRLRPGSAATGSKAKASKQRSKAKSKAGSEETATSQKKKEEDTLTESPLSHSLSAADLLKETKRCQKMRNLEEPEERVLTPACLPNASPNEVVSDWLRSIPAHGGMMAFSDELGDGEEEQKEEKPECKEEIQGMEEEAAAEDKEEKTSDPAPGDAPGTEEPITDEESLSRNWSSSAVMKVLLNSSLGRSRSLPEVSPLYGRRLSSSARGLLDCLAQLQGIDPLLGPGGDRQKIQDKQQQQQRYDDITTILQSLWLGEPRGAEALKQKAPPPEQVTPPRSSSGVDMSSGSAGSGKENGNQGDSGTPPKEVGGGAAAAERGEEERQCADSPKENPSSSDKGSANDSSKSPTDNETADDTSSGTPTTVLRAPLSERASQDPNPVWVLHLLKKLEKQFINHYISAMADFKVRWELDDSLLLDTMICELREEVSRRIQSSIDSEIKKIRGRAGRGGRSPRHPQAGNLSRESTMTDRRRQLLKVMKNQSVKTADSLSDGDLTGEFSDQRSDDEYCPCDACVKKKMAARPLKAKPMAPDAPVRMEFDLLKILQLKKGPPPPSPSPPPPPPVTVLQSADSVVVEEEGRSLEVVQEEEEEEEETKEHIKAVIVLEEVIPEEDEKVEEEDGGPAAGEEEVSAEGEENEGGEEEQEEEEEEECQCQCGKNDEEGEEEENVGDEEETRTGEEEETDSKPEEEEETPGGNEEPTRLEEKDDGEEEPSEEREGGEREEQEGEATSPQEQEVSEGEEADAEDSDTDKKRPSDTAGEEEEKEEGGDGEEERGDEEEKEGGGDQEEEREEGGDGNEEEEKKEGGDEEEVEEKDTVEEMKPVRSKKEEGTLLHQFTRTSVESQPGSLEEISTD